MRNGMAIRRSIKVCTERCCELEQVIAIRERREYAGQDEPFYCSMGFTTFPIVTIVEAMKLSDDSLLLLWWLERFRWRLAPLNLTSQSHQNPAKLAACYTSAIGSL